jgi:hypothetical protein
MKMKFQKRWQKRQNKIDQSTGRRKSMKRNLPRKVDGHEGTRGWSQ